MQTSSELDLLRDLLPDAVQREERRERREIEKKYPKPDEQDILEIEAELEALWHEWRYGDVGEAEDGDTEPPRGLPGLTRIRDMRYHRDQMPRKWSRLLNSPQRWRTAMTAIELARTVALATRNPPRVKIPPSSADHNSQKAATYERRWCENLLPALERQANLPLLRMGADSLFEGGLGAFEVYTRETYDEVDVRRFDGESSEAYEARTDEALKSATMRYGMPIGLRHIDPMSLLFDTDDLGVSEALIVEYKSYRRVHGTLKRRYGHERLEELRLPKPGDHGWPATLGDQPGNTSPNGLVKTIRYYNRYWYAYLVAGQIVDGPTPHGFPGVPVIPSAGNVTSSARLIERFQGVVADVVEQEQLINDTMTAAIDIGMTFGRPKVAVERHPDAPLSDEAVALDLTDPHDVPRMNPGERLVDAYKDFQSRISPHLVNTMISLRQQAGINPIMAGESPGADPSGFAINSLQASSMMRYEILIDNYARWVGMVVDFIRQTIKHGSNIGDRVFVPVETPEGVADYLGLGPDEISDMPCVVIIDPTTDVNRLARRQSLMAAYQAGMISKRMVQEEGFGIEDPDRLDDEIAEDLAESQMLRLAFEVAKHRVLGDLATIGDSPIPNPGEGGGGEGGMMTPVPPDDDGQPHRPRGSTVGREMAEASARARGGQQPANQGIPAGTPAGAP